MLSIMYLSITPCSGGNEWEHIVEGSLLLKRGNIQGAISEYEEAIKENPRLVDAYSSLGHIYQYELKNNTKAIEIYSKGLKHDPNDYSLNLNIMYAFFDLGDNSNGIKYYEALSNMRSGEKTYSFPRETLHDIIQDMTRQEALGFCKKYLAMNPTDTGLREVLVDLYLKQKDYEYAESELQAMLRHGEETSSVYFDLGTCNYNLKQYEKALEFFSRAKQLGAYVPQEFFDRLYEKVKQEDVVD